jgi:hypothetical protein
MLGMVKQPVCEGMPDPKRTRSLRRKSSRAIRLPSSQLPRFPHPTSPTGPYSWDNTTPRIHSATRTNQMQTCRCSTRTDRDCRHPAQLLALQRTRRQSTPPLSKRQERLIQRHPSFDKYTLAFSGCKTMNCRVTSPSHHVIVEEIRWHVILRAAKNLARLWRGAPPLAVGFKGAVRNHEAVSQVV